jgi:hypothetical protein
MDSREESSLNAQVGFLPHPTAIPTDLIMEGWGIMPVLDSLSTAVDCSQRTTAMGWLLVMWDFSVIYTQTRSFADTHGTSLVTRYYTAEVLASQPP